MVEEPEGSALLILEPAIGCDFEPVNPLSIFTTFSPKIYFNVILLSPQPFKRQYTYSTIMPGPSANYSMVSVYFKEHGHSRTERHCCEQTSDSFWWSATTCTCTGQSTADVGHCHCKCNSVV